MDEYFDNTDIRANTPDVITDPDRIKNQLITVAKESVAYDDGELHPDFNSSSVGIREIEERLVAGNGFVGLSLQLPQAVMKEIASNIKQCTIEISMYFG